MGPALISFDGQHRVIYHPAALELKVRHWRRMHGTGPCCGRCRRNGSIDAMPLDAHCPRRHGAGKGSIG